MVCRNKLFKDVYLVGFDFFCEVINQNHNDGCVTELSTEFESN